MKDITDDIGELIKGFEKYIKDERASSENTVQAYVRDVKKFADYAKHKNINVKTAVRQDVISYARYLQSIGSAQSSVTRAVAGIRMFYKYLIKEEKTVDNPTCKLKLPKCEKKPPEILTPAEIEILMNCPNSETFKGKRDRAMLELMYASGMKVSELVSLKICDIDTDLGFVKCVSLPNARIVPIGAPCVEALKDYLSHARLYMVESKEESALFVNRGGTKITRQGFWKIIKEYSGKCGITKDVTPHTLRHSFAVHMLQNGADISAVREMLGHSDIFSTQSYAQLARPRIKDVYVKSHPRA